MNGYVSYGIGWWTHRWWPRRAIVRCLAVGRDPDGRPVPRRAYLRVVLRDLRLIRRPHRPWQAENTLDGCSCNAARALTPQGAVRAAARLHARRAVAPLVPGTPLAGKRGRCWSTLTEAEREAAR